MPKPFAAAEVALSSSSLANRLASHAKSAPNRIAVVSSDRTLTWADLNSAVQSFSGWLRSQDWFKRGSRVILALPNSDKLIISYFGVILSEGIVTPVSPKIKSSEFEYICDQIDPSLIICSANFACELKNSTNQSRLTLCEREPKGASSNTMFFWDQVLDHDPSTHKAVCEPEDICVIAFSTGTTGRPKGCMLSNRALGAQVEAWSAWVGLNQNSRSLISLPLFHIAGMQTGMNASVHVGSTMILSSRWDPDEFAAQIADHRPTHWVGTTTMVVDLVGNPTAGPANYDSFRMMGGGGAPMPATLADKFCIMTGHDYIDGYGLTETAGAVLINPIGAPKCGSIGIALSNSRVCVVDVDRGIPLAPGEVGEIVVSGPTLFSGYWNHETETKQAFREIPGFGSMFRTGDIGQIDAEGRFYIVDRLKRLIIVSGQKVAPSEVEGVLQCHPKVAECCVVSSPDPRYGEAVKAFVVPHNASDIPTLDELQKWSGIHLSSYKWPRKIEIVANLPRGETGKVSWKALQDAEWSR